MEDVHKSEKEPRFWNNFKEKIAHIKDAELPKSDSVQNIVNMINGIDTEKLSHKQKSGHKLVRSRT